PLSAWPPPEDTSPGRLRVRRCRGTSAQGPPLVAQLARRFRPLGMTEEETVLHQPAGDDAAALEQQLRLGATDERGGFEQASPGPDAEGDAPRVADRLHEVRIGQRVRRG